MDGHKITEPSQLDSNGQYVAVGRERLYVLIFVNFLFRQYYFYFNFCCKSSKGSFREHKYAVCSAYLKNIYVYTS